MKKTYSAKPLEVERKWIVIDAKDQTLGRLATTIATLLRGKHKPEFTPHIDTGDFVIVLNAKDVKVTGKKPAQKMYYRNTGYPGGLRTINFEDLIVKSPEKVIEYAVWGMIPHTRLGRQQIRKLNVYPGAEHPHAAQKPETYRELEAVK
jgi:large subunit ribosomal protein L13